MIGAGGVAKGVQALTPSVTNNEQGISQTKNVGAGPSFAETLGNQIGKMPSVDPKTLSGVGSQLPGAQVAGQVKFSNHAVERMVSRGISFSPKDMDRLNDAVARAQAKGSKDSLILMNDSALIVSVKNKTVVTVMDKAALRENVFTNIDSTIVM